MELDLYFASHTHKKINSEWVKDLNSAEAVKIMAENIGEILLGNDLLL